SELEASLREGGLSGVILESVLAALDEGPAAGASAPAPAAAAEPPAPRDAAPAGEEGFLGMVDLPGEERGRPAAPPAAGGSGIGDAIRALTGGGAARPAPSAARAAASDRATAAIDDLLGFLAGPLLAHPA